MPILVKDFTWRESSDLISIRVPLKGIHNSKVDVLISDKLVKLHFPPFIFEIFLLHPIKESEGECTFTDTEAFLVLVKAESKVWEQLEAEFTKEEKKKIKEEVINNTQIKTRQFLDERINMRTTLDRFAVHEAMEYDTKRRQKIDKLRDLERQTAMDDFEKWKNETTPPSVKPLATEYKNGVKITELPPEEKTIGKNINHGTARKDAEVSLKTKPEKESLSKPKKSNFYTKVMNDIEKRELPAPRQTGVLNVSFTKRVFPTPSRESSCHNEEVWLKNLNEARRAIGFVSEDLRPEEQDPQWCKDKGDDFHKVGNYLGAISAYSHGITLSNKLPSLYSNRAVSHFAMGNFNKCIEDCSSALDLLKPHCQANLDSRARCIARRAAALTRIGMLGKAIDEMKAAVKLQPNNEKLKNDMYTMERAWEQNPDSD